MACRVRNVSVSGGRRVHEAPLGWEGRFRSPCHPGRHRSQEVARTPSAWFCAGGGRRVSKENQVRALIAVAAADPTLRDQLIDELRTRSTA